MVLFKAISRKTYLDIRYCNFRLISPTIVNYAPTKHNGKIKISLPLKKNSIISREIFGSLGHVDVLSSKAEAVL